MHGSLLTLVKPSVAAGSSHDNHLTLAYTRAGWSPISTADTQSIDIESVKSFPPSVVSSNVPNSGNLREITVGEDITFRVTLSLPVSTNKDFTLEVFGQGAEGIAGKITRVGNNIQSLHGQITGAGKCSGKLKLGISTEKRQLFTVQS